MAARPVEPRAASAALPVAHELELSREFDAPRELVFRMWTEPEHFARWFGPHGAEMPECELDPRPGGAIHFVHRHRDTEVRIKGTFTEVTPPARLSFDLGFVDAKGRTIAHPMVPGWPIDAVIATTVILKPLGRRTRLDIRHTVHTAHRGADAAIAEERRMAGLGWGETLERLAERLAELA